MEKNNEPATSLKKSILRTSSLYSSSLRVTFDEEIIEQHNKLRGSKMIIDEPKTPFHYFDKEGNEIPPPKSTKRKSVNLIALNEELEKEKEKMGIESSEDEVVIDEKRKKFMEKRRSHYSNEFCGSNPLLKKFKDDDENKKSG